MAERDRRSIALGGQGAAEWSNHYSPKYTRCFVKAAYMGSVKGGPIFRFMLIDAFERGILATSAGGGSSGRPFPIASAIEISCRSEEKPAECKEAAAMDWELACRIDGQAANCEKADDFITEHMKN